jgi:hypothetical protein
MLAREHRSFHAQEAHVFSARLIFVPDCNSRGPRYVRRPTQGPRVIPGSAGVRLRRR